MTAPQGPLDPVARNARRAVEILAAAKAEAVKKCVTKWEEPDPNEVAAIAGIILQLVLAEERNGTVPLPHQLTAAGMRFFVCGMHFPGHFEDGYPVVTVMAPGVKRMLPADCLPVAIIIPPGREAEFLKTYPEATWA